VRGAIQWLGVAVVGVGLASACGASVESEPMQPKEIVFITPSSSGGTGGSEPTAGGPGAGSSSGGTAGRVDAEEFAGAGAGGGHECDGYYMCRAVQYMSHAIIKVDLPISVAEAADAIFTACRNTECHSAKGSAQDPHEKAWALTDDVYENPILLDFDGSEAAPFAVLDWGFVYHGPAEFAEASDHYSLTVQATADAAPTTLFDEQVQYELQIADHSWDPEVFCIHCYEVPGATVDRRTVP
jgi:hypothetical protein